MEHSALDTSVRSAIATHGLLSATKLVKGVLPRGKSHPRALSSSDSQQTAHLHLLLGALESSSEAAVTGGTEPLASTSVVPSLCLSCMPFPMLALAGAVIPSERRGEVLQGFKKEPIINLLLVSLLPR